MDGVCMGRVLLFIPVRKSRCHSRYAKVCTIHKSHVNAYLTTCIYCRCALYLYVSTYIHKSIYMLYCRCELCLYVSTYIHERIYLSKKPEGQKQHAKVILEEDPDLEYAPKGPEEERREHRHGSLIDMPRQPAMACIACQHDCVSRYGFKKKSRPDFWNCGTILTDGAWQLL